MGGSIALAIYSGLGYLAVPILHWLHAKRTLNGKELRSRKGERFGRASCQRPDGPLIWVHAASVGETNSVIPMIRSFCDRGMSVLLTTGTVTSARLAAEKLPETAIHQFVPYDASPLVKRFLDFWRPDAAILVESEIWPMIAYGLSLRKTPCVLVNGRMSKASLRNWQRISGICTRIFGSFDLCLAQSELDAERFRQLGVSRVEFAGNIKFDTEPLIANANDLNLLKTQIGDRMCWLTASTHKGEEETVVNAHIELKKRFPDILTVIVPRHPERGGEVVGICKEFNLKTNRRSESQPIGRQDEVYVADSLGETGLFYSLCEIVFLGGSFVSVGGHNPVEPAQLDSAILTGPNFENNKRLFESLLEADGALVVQDAVSLADEVSNLLNNRERRGELAINARMVVESGRGALKRSEMILEEALSNVGCFEKM